MKVSEFKTVYLPKIKPSDRVKITNSKEVSEILKPFYADYIEHREAFFVVLLNRANKVIGVNRISEGGISSTVADMKIIFQTALLANASAIILSHNHPSGEMKFSDQDKELTRKAIEVGKVLDLKVLDHILMGVESYLSWTDEGMN